MHPPEPDSLGKPGEAAGPSTLDGPAPAPEPLVEATLKLAERHAELTHQWLCSIGYSPAGRVNVPVAFLFELAALLQIGEWERHGVCSVLGTALPSYADAAEQLAGRAARGPKEFHGPDATPLAILVNKTWFERFAWEGPSILDAEVVFGNCDDDALAGQLADFLFQHHDKLIELGET